MTAPTQPAEEARVTTWAEHAPLPWSVDDDDPKCVRDRRWTVVVDLMTGNDEADRALARLIVDAANAFDEERKEAERQIKALVDAVTETDPRQEPIARALYKHDNPEPRFLWPPWTKPRTVNRYRALAAVALATLTTDRDRLVRDLAAARAERDEARERLQEIDEALRLPASMGTHERLARILGRIEDAQEHEGDAENRADDAEEKLAAAQAENATLRAALKPFGNHCAWAERHHWPKAIAEDPRTPVYGATGDWGEVDGELTVGDFQIARSALTGETNA